MIKPYYEDEWTTLYNCDCREILPKLPRVDLVLTDPPYGVEFRGNTWDREIPSIALELPNMFEKVVIITGITAAWEFPKPKWMACWARPASNSRSKIGGFSHWSPILIYGDVELSVDYRAWHAIANAYPQDFGHPSPKPLCLMKWLVSEMTEELETILDPFAGSGTTLVAAKILKRKSIGIEISEKYCEIIVNRLNKPIPLFEQQEPLKLL